VLVLPICDGFSAAGLPAPTREGYKPMVTPWTCRLSDGQPQQFLRSLCQSLQHLDIAKVRISVAHHTLSLNNPSSWPASLIAPLGAARLSCRKAGKAGIFTPVRDSSGESRLRKSD
jgi:hypothetical protein